MVTTECIEKPSPASAGERFLGFAEAALARVIAFWRSVQNRRSVAKLLDWDDRMLRDIGLTSGDVRSVMAMPVGEDPSFRLSILSVERRAAVRAAARERVSRAGLAPEPRPSFQDAERGTRSPQNRASRFRDLEFRSSSGATVPWGSD